MCLNLEEGALTNNLIWVTSLLIESIAFVVHLQDVVDQKFGPLSGRMDTLFVQYYAKYTNEKGSLHALLVEDFLIFGATSVSVFKRTPNTCYLE